MSKLVLSLFTVCVIAVTVSATQAPQIPPADLVLRGGRIVTLDAQTPEVTALAARNGAIVALGTDAAIAPYVGPATQVIELKGQLAVPGLIEGHGHFTGVGENRINLDFMNTKSWDEIVHMVADAVEKAKPGEWIVGRGWHQDKWTSRPDPNVEGFPLHAALDKVSPNNPVVLTHASGHASFVNAKAMELSGVTKATPNPTGGEILKDKNGDPTGLMRETAQGLVRRPAATEADIRRQLALADDEAISKGITTFHDAGSSFRTLDVVRKMIDEGQMHVRLWMMIRESNAALQQNVDKYRVVGYGNNQLTVRAIKVTADGALGSRGAWMLEPYADKPDSVGTVPEPVVSRNGQPPPLATTAQIAIDHHMQLCVHAIGDRANREVLNIYEAAFKSRNVNGKDLRFRIEHAQHLSAADIPRFGQLGVIAAMQANHCTSDGTWVPDRIGDKRAEEGAYVWQKLMQSGAIVSNGTDAPVENVDPIANYYSAVTRKLSNGKVFYPDQRMSRLEALKSYTIMNAIAGFEEDIKGTLSLGKLADITVLTKDITTVPEEEIKTAKVAYTIIGGKIVYKAQ
ncbi:MAG TPA: amidohydrolase [Vicinamibacterales bacterium]|nr:amidohydrolase [Vicinamibacterales bacterium]